MSALSGQEKRAMDPGPSEQLEQVSCTEINLTGQRRVAAAPSAGSLSNRRERLSRRQLFSQNSGWMQLWRLTWHLKMDVW